MAKRNDMPTRSTLEQLPLDGTIPSILCWLAPRELGALSSTGSFTLRRAVCTAWHALLSRDFPHVASAPGSSAFHEVARQIAKQKREMREGTDEFWAFVDDISWGTQGYSPDSEAIEAKMRSNYTAAQIAKFEDEGRRHMARVSSTVYGSINKDEGVHFGGGDDFCGDLTGEVVGRGKSFFLEHADSVTKLAEFGNSGPWPGSQVKESFAYIFHAFNPDFC
jgi:hypothetical protein